MFPLPSFSELNREPISQSFRSATGLHTNEMFPRIAAPVAAAPSHRRTVRLLCSQHNRTIFAARKSVFFFFIICSCRTSTASAKARKIKKVKGEKFRWCCEFKGFANGGKELYSLIPNFHAGKLNGGFIGAVTWRGRGGKAKQKKFNIHLRWDPVVWPVDRVWNCYEQTCCPISPVGAHLPPLESILPPATEI